jgi:uncharacterized protein
LLRKRDREASGRNHPSQAIVAFLRARSPGRRERRAVSSGGAWAACSPIESSARCVHVPPRWRNLFNKPRKRPMPYSMSQASIPVFEIGLAALSNVLDKAVAYAGAKKFEPAVFLQSRLAPDMFALTRQVQIACDQAKNGLSRLAGVEPPRFEDNEATIDDLKARIAKTLAYIKTLDSKPVDGAGAREITFPLGPVHKGHMKGDDYLTHFMLPNFYFHLSAAYAILRHCGVDIGKQDFLGAIPIKIT